MLCSLLLTAAPIRVEIAQPAHEASVLEKLAPFAWPAIVLICLIVLRKPIIALLKDIGSRATELSIGSWATIKLPDLQEAAFPALTIKDLVGTFWTESGSNLNAQFQSTNTPEYALVDLGNGDEWISSRLFIFAVMLQRMKALRCIVFIQTSPTKQRKFLGCAAPENVRWRLAVDQPWLESAFATAYAQIMLPPGALSRGDAFTDTKGALQPPVAQLVVSNFVASLKQIPLPGKANEYISIGSGSEHATWMTASELDRIMGRDLWTDSVPENTDTNPESNRAYIRSILDKPSPYVAQLSNSDFKSLISRVALLDEVAKRFK